MMALLMDGYEWTSSSDPDSKIAKMKDGTTHLAYKAEHVLDLDSEFVLAATILPADHGDVDLPDRSTPFRREPLDRGRGRDDLAGLGLAGHAVGRMHRRAENVPAFEHHGPKMAADPDRHHLAFNLELGVGGDELLHLRRRIQRLVRARKARHDLIAHGLDHRAMALLGGAAHDIDAGGNHIARAQISHQLIEPGRADDIGKSMASSMSLPM